MEESRKRPSSSNDEQQQQPPLKKQHTLLVREPSIFGHKPVDDITKYIANFIAQHVHQENVEVLRVERSYFL